MQGVRFEKLTDNRELLSIPKSITHLNWKPEKGKDYHRQETTPRSIQVIQLGECAPMFVGVQALFSYRPRYVPEGKEIQLISSKSRNPACREATASLKASFSPYKPTEKVALPRSLKPKNL